MLSKSGIANTLDASYRRVVALIDSLDDAQLRAPYHPGINPPVWEGGHAAFFYELFLLRPWKRTAPIMPGMDNVWGSFDIDHEDRWAPGVVQSKQATLDYMRRVHESVCDCLAERELTPQDVYLYRFGIFHQHMHVESMIWAPQTLGYPPPPFARTLQAPVAADEVTAAEDATVPAGRYRIGMPACSPEFAAADFAFDNEKPGFEVNLPEFRISKRLVSNREFLEFVEDGGYRTDAWWSWGGRKWLRAQAAPDCHITRPALSTLPDCPIYWRKDAGGWWLRHFDRWIPLPLDQTVLHVCYWEGQPTATGPAGACPPSSNGRRQRSAAPRRRPGAPSPGARR